MARFRAFTILFFVLAISFRPLHARVTILWVSCWVEAATRSCGFKFLVVIISAIGCGPRFLSVLSFISQSSYSLSLRPLYNKMWRFGNKFPPLFRPPLMT